MDARSQTMGKPSSRARVTGDVAAKGGAEPPTGAGPPCGAAPARSPAPAAPAQGTLVMTSDQFAGQLRDVSTASFLYGTMSQLFQVEDTLAYRKFRDRLLADAGDPTDPVEIMLIEQIV